MRGRLDGTAISISFKKCVLMALGPARAAARMRLSATDAVIVALVLAGCATETKEPAPKAADQTQFIEEYQVGDNDLDCGSLIAQMNQMDHVIFNNSGNGVAGRMASTGVTSGLGYVPVFGGLASSVAGAGTSGYSQSTYTQQANQRSMAQRRKQRLLQLFQKKKC